METLGTVVVTIVAVSVIGLMVYMARAFSSGLDKQIEAK